MKGILGHSHTKEAVLGLSALYHDSGVAIVGVDGDVLYAAHEERFTRRKFDPAIPVNALKQAQIFCEKNGIRIVDFVYYENPELKAERQNYMLGYMRGANPALGCEKAKSVNPKRTRHTVQAAVSNFFGDAARVSFDLTHHLSHAASAFYTSGFDTALTLVFDGVGEWETATAFVGSGKTLEKVWSRKFPDSLGLFYSAMTQLCGFKVNSGEYKLMGLAPYGEPRHVEDLAENILVQCSAPQYFSLNQRFLGYLYSNSTISDDFLNLFGLDGIPRDGEQQKIHLDLAASTQKLLEQTVSTIVSDLMQKTGQTNLCLAGGVALNCVMNSKLEALEAVKQLYIQPAAGDAGSALGAALKKAANYDTFIPRKMPVPYLGNQYSKETSLNALQKASIDVYTVFESDKAFIKAIVDRLEKGRVGGLFIGRSEFGPRALGSRSIIANAAGQDVQKRINLKVKFRESFRPFAPMVLEEDAAVFFKNCVKSPFMLQTYEVLNSNPIGPVRDKSVAEKVILAHLSNNRADYPAITHVDGSARVQTVGSENGFIFDLLSCFKEKMGHSILVNTSFNVRGEPIVEKPEDAINCFLGTDLDFLAIEGIVIDKADIPKDLIKHAYKDGFDAD